MLVQYQKKLGKIILNKFHHGFNNSSNFCKMKKKCIITNLCNSNCHTQCSKCQKCNQICDKYEEDICILLQKPPYVCNGCENYIRCRKIKYVYRAKEAQAKYVDKLVSSREGINLSQEQLDKLDKLITPLIKQGQSLAAIYNNHSKEIPCTKRCLYNYIDMGILSVKNIDLPRRVKYKIRKKKNKNKEKRDPSIRIGRTYDDFQAFLEQNPNANIVEMDTVEGKKGGKVLLTLLFRNTNFMLAILLPNKTSNSVINAFNHLENLLGLKLFTRLFNYILTDNGGEFQKPNELEISIRGKKRCHIYYCDPYRSDQKGKIEKNHEYIRYIIPKGTSMDNYTQEDINLVMSHINSVAREYLNFATPFDMANIYLGMDTMSKFSIVKIQPDNIILKPYLINK